jgi:hypothetical protein
MISFKDIKGILGIWNIWVSILFLLIPGITYQLQITKIDLSYFSGTLVIVFLIISIYYAIPFIISGFFANMAYSQFKNRLNQEDLFIISFMSIGTYFATKLVADLLNTNFWGVYSLYLIILFAIGYKNWIKLFSKGEKIK